MKKRKTAVIFNNAIEFFLEEEKVPWNSFCGSSRQNSHVNSTMNPVIPSLTGQLLFISFLLRDEAFDLIHERWEEHTGLTLLGEDVCILVSSTISNSFAITTHPPNEPHANTSSESLHLPRQNPR